MNSSNFNALYEIQITKYIDKEYVPFIEDLIKILLLQFVLQFMYFLKNPTDHPFFSFDFIEMMIYIFLGTSVYWLIIKKLVSFR
jgi:hypothetical protein